jgi:hypothetical protein
MARYEGKWLMLNQGTGIKPPQRFSPALQAFRKLLAGINTFSKFVNAKHSQIRWLAAKTTNSEPKERFIGQGLDAISILAINLDRRSDRLEKFSHEMKRLGVQQWTRIPAVDGKKKYVNLAPIFAGSIACTESHIQALALERPPGTLAVMVCEDDLEFLTNRAEISELIQEFLENRLLSVLCLSGRARGGSFPISEKLRISTGIVGRGCYIAKPDAVQPLIDAFAEGIPELIRGRVEGKGDRKWGRLQRRGLFFATPRYGVAQQSAGYSDIEDVVLGPR